MSVDFPLSIPVNLQFITVAIHLIAVLTVLIVEMSAEEWVEDEMLWENTELYVIFQGTPRALP